MLTSRYRNISDRLEPVLAEWRRQDQEPEAAGALSRDERRALALAARHPRADPIIDFLLLDKSLQRWVLGHLGASDLVGMRVGVD